MKLLPTVESYLAVSDADPAKRETIEQAIANSFVDLTDAEQALILVFKENVLMAAEKLISALVAGGRIHVQGCGYAAEASASMALLFAKTSQICMGERLLQDSWDDLAEQTWENSQSMGGHFAEGEDGDPDGQVPGFVPGDDTVH